MRSSIRYALLLAFAVLAAPSVARAQTPETIEYYGADTIGSIRIVFDVNGTVLGRRDFTPFGTPVVPAPTMPKEGFSGNEKDDETDLSYFHARMFQARTGRFNAIDPLSDGVFEPQRWNRYAYALNNPLRYTDPSGTNADPCAGTDYNTGTCVTGHVTNPDWEPSTSSCWWWCNFGGGGIGGGGNGFTGRDVGGGGVQLPPTTLPGDPVPIPQPPGQPPPHVPPSMPPRLQAALNRAFDEMMRRLRNPRCSGLFGGYEVAEPAVNNANYRFIPLGPPSQQPSGAWSVTGAETISNATPQLVLINSQGPFLNTTLLTSSGPQDFASYHQHGTSNAAFILLHEAGHLTHVFGPDAGNADLTAKYSLMVYNSCFK